MSATPELDRLCAHYGIAAAYEDVEGRRHQAGDSTRRALLRALGVTAGDPATEEQSLAQVIDQEWQGVLAPVIVHRQGDEAPMLALSLPDQPELMKVRLVLTEESGSATEAELDLGRLPAEEQREIDGQHWQRRTIAVPAPTEIGYHQLAIHSSVGEILARSRVIVAPRRCWQPDDQDRGDRGQGQGHDGERDWGLVTQLHALRSARNWGIGDFTDLTRLVETAARAGAGAVGLSPLHALFPAQPERCDPYRPSSRRFLNPLHLDVEAVAELDDCPAARELIDGDEFNALLRALRGAPMVDHAAVTEAKLRVLSLLFRGPDPHRRDAKGPRETAFQAFRDEQGEPLQRFAIHQALSEHFAAAEPGPLGHEHWPAAYKNPHSDEVAAFAREHAERVDFFAWLQWLARLQFESAGNHCQELGMAQGLLLDLAVGAAPDGADHWVLPGFYIQGAHVGAPPDDFSPKGQNWDVLAWHPSALREAGYEPFAAELRANMRAAGGLRIDHVMGLMRLFLIPDGEPPTAGTYLAYPLDELLGVLALESVRNRCMIIGEDLGTVPELIRKVIPDWGILSTRVLYFERADDGGFLEPSAFEPNAMVTAGTHDLPPLAGFWQGVDLEQRRELELFPSQQDYDQRLLQRTQDRTRLFLALKREGLLSDHEGADPVDVPRLGAEHLRAIHVYLARTASRLLLIQTADLLAETEQVNLPGSGDRYPNWRRRQPLQLEHWLERPEIRSLFAAVRAERGASASCFTGAEEPEFGHQAGAASGSARTDIGQSRSGQANSGQANSGQVSSGQTDTTQTKVGRSHAERPPGEQASAKPNSGTPLQARIPRATYRLQLHKDFGFAAATELVPYLADLGISHCYFSPYLKARPGSTHGYDVVDHSQLNPELGSQADYECLCETLAAHGMGQILDLVPNHVGIMGGENPWWLDVLENGPASEHADFFDIDWQPLKQELHGKVLVPVLGDHYGVLLDGGELRLVFADGAFRVDYYEHRFPIDPREYPRILAPGLASLRERLQLDDPAPDSAPDPAPDSAPDPAPDSILASFESLITAFGKLPPRSALDQASLTERKRDKELHKQRLAELCQSNADLRRYIQDCLQAYNGTDDYPADSERLHTLLEAQAYRLAHWRVAADEINYRRFFDINDLAALRMENPKAFEATHALVLHLIAEGRVQGLRIDHPDGLFDPAAYFRNLQQRAASVLHPQRTPLEADQPLYLAAEKILVGDEPLREDWPVHGTTGYDFATLSDALFVDSDGEAELDRCYQDFVGSGADSGSTARPARQDPARQDLARQDLARHYGDEVHAAKRLVMKNLLSSELHVLASEAARIAEMDPHTRDYTLDALRSALMEVVACFPVYRTYITDQGVSTADRNQVLKAVSEARRRSRMPDQSVFEFVRDLLLTDIAAGKPESYRERVLRLAMKFQQYSSPVTAKSVEDTAFYRWHRLSSLNEVGGDPERFGLALDSFHRANARRQAQWPHAMLAGSTHDSKRSEDVRARLHVLSELPLAWREHVERWTRLNRRFRRGGEGQDPLAADALSWPDANTEYLLYQTLLGVWPLRTPEDNAGWQQLKTRIQDYMSKAVKEAKVHTAWTNANPDYEAALEAFIDAMLERERSSAFFEDFISFQQRVAQLGLFNSLSQTLLRLTSPGLPDLYQGCELWDFSLVDPDNRRAVDFERRRHWLSEIDGSDRIGELSDGRAKLSLIRRALLLREQMPELFTEGEYSPLTVEGPHAHRLCAFSRSHQGQSVVVIAPRLLAGLSELAVTDHGDAGSSTGDLDPLQNPGWDETWISIPAARLDDALSGSEGGTERDPESDSEDSRKRSTDAGLGQSLNQSLGQPLETEQHKGRQALRASRVLRRFPVGLLTTSAP
ncbi:Maltooligosyl trehalose synthase [Thiorhodovibrio winogradskyi]|uniref:4-alpha-glucanotransferase n=1 Tax=Thiorhodovibrio winogradskyi TaxID=77007 RepID=A0ABZ0SDL3_9GAMM|nr:malto-oligosyltrehalose synthase [Thiorhodovibrio winogradskyi]